MCGGQGKEGLGIRTRTLRRSFLCVFDFNVKNETIENADFKMFLEGGHCPSLAGCKQPAAVRVYTSPSKNL